MFLRTKSEAPTETAWYSPGANRNATLDKRSFHSSPAYRGYKRRSTLENVGTAAVGTAVSGLMIFVIAYFAAKVVLLPIFIVNICYLITAFNTPHGTDHFNPTWLVISGLVVLFG